MNNDEPLISVVILTFNHEAYVQQAIQSVLDQQTTSRFEIIIGDDYSSDNTRQIINGYKKQYPALITTYYPEKNNGLLSNYTNCIKLCKGKFLASCAGDDYWHNSEKLQKQLKLFIHHPEIGVVHSDADFFYQPTGKRIKAYRKSNKTIILSGFIYEKLLIDNFILALTAMVRLDLIKQFVDFEEYLNLGFFMEDYPMWLELSYHSKIEYLDESLATYRIHKKSIRNNENPAKLLDFLNTTYNVKNHFINKYGCTDEVKLLVEERYFKKVLFFANVLHNKILAKVAFNWLSANSRKIRIVEYLYFWTTQSAMINNLSSVLIRKLRLLK